MGCADQAIPRKHDAGVDENTKQLSEPERDKQPDLPKLNKQLLVHVRPALADAASGAQSDQDPAMTADTTSSAQSRQVLVNLGQQPSGQDSLKTGIGQQSVVGDTTVLVDEGHGSLKQRLYGFMAGFGIPGHAASPKVNPTSVYPGAAPETAAACPATAQCVPSCCHALCR